MGGGRGQSRRGQESIIEEVDLLKRYSNRALVYEFTETALAKIRRVLSVTRCSLYYN